MSSVVEAKAAMLVLGGRVEIRTVAFNDDGLVLCLTATVRGDNGTYQVTVTPERTTCTCQYGEARQDATGHSHDIAARVAAKGQT